MLKCIVQWFKKKPHVHVFNGADGWRVRVVAANGEIMLGSEAYSTRSNAIRAADNLCVAFGLDIRVDPIPTPTLET